jgi:hypothetical protein
VPVHKISPVHKLLSTSNNYKERRSFARFKLGGYARVKRGRERPPKRRGIVSSPGLIRPRSFQQRLLTIPRPSLDFATRTGT